jgi:hypothetical protein
MTIARPLAFNPQPLVHFLVNFRPDLADNDAARIHWSAFGERMKGR